MRKTFAIFFVFIKVVLMQPVSAHESQPGSLEMKQVGQDRWDITWRAPIYYGKPHPARLQLPQDWQTIGQPTRRRRPDSIIFQRVITTDGKSTDGKIVRFPGLETTISDVFVRLTRLDGSVMITVARPTKPWAELRGKRPWHATAGEYIGTGFHHILLGVDHLLFVLGLLLIVRSRMMLLKPSHPLPWRIPLPWPSPRWDTPKRRCHRLTPPSPCPFCSWARKWFDPGAVKPV